MARRVATALLTVALASSVAMPAGASLVPSLDGTLVYDTDQNITWLADANYRKTLFSGLGILPYPEAIVWVAGLEFGGHTDWRLPVTLDPDAGCADQPSSSTGLNCTGSEMGHLFYVELSGTGNEAIWMSGDPDLALFDQLDNTIGHWSETIASPTQSFLFRFAVGSQNVTGNTGPQGLLMWPVHPGNITGVTAVPIPAGQWLFVSVLVGLSGFGILRAYDPSETRAER
jgi:hypothetical protein